MVTRRALALERLGNYQGALTGLFELKQMMENSRVLLQDGEALNRDMVRVSEALQVAARGALAAAQAGAVSEAPLVRGSPADSPQQPRRRQVIPVVEDSMSSDEYETSSQDVPGQDRSSPAPASPQAAAPTTGSGGRSATPVPGALVQPYALLAEALQAAPAWAGALTQGAAGKAATPAAAAGQPKRAAVSVVDGSSSEEEGGVRGGACDSGGDGGGARGADAGAAGLAPASAHGAGRGRSGAGGAAGRAGAAPGGAAGGAAASAAGAAGGATATGAQRGKSGQTQTPAERSQQSGRGSSGASQPQRRRAAAGAAVSPPGGAGASSGHVPATAPAADSAAAQRGDQPRCPLAFPAPQVASEWLAQAQALLDQERARAIACEANSVWVCTDKARGRLEKVSPEGAQHKLNLQAADRERQVGNEHFKAGQLAQARQAYTRAIDGNRLDPRGYSNRAQVAVKLQQWQAALDDCNMALALVQQGAHLLQIPGEACCVWDDAKQSKAVQRRATALMQLGVQRADADLAHAARRDSVLLLQYCPDAPEYKRLFDQIKVARAKLVTANVASYQQAQQQQQQLQQVAPGDSNPLPPRGDSSGAAGSSQAGGAACSNGADDAAAVGVRSGARGSAEGAPPANGVAVPLALAGTAFPANPDAAATYRTACAGTEGGVYEPPAAQPLPAQVTSQYRMNRIDIEETDGSESCDEEECESAAPPGAPAAGAGAGVRVAAGLAPTPGSAAAASPLPSPPPYAEALTAPAAGAVEPLPTSAAEFDKTCQRLKDEARDRAKSQPGVGMGARVAAYVKAIDPSQFQRVFGQDLTQDCIAAFATVLEMDVTADPGYALRCLTELAALPSFPVVMEEVHRHPSRRRVLAQLRAVLTALASADNDVARLARLYRL